MGFAEAVLRLLGVIAALVFVLFLAWLLIRWLNKRVPGVSSGGGKRLIQVVDRVNTGRSSGLMLVRVHTKLMLIGFSDHNTQLLGEFDDPDGEITALEEVSMPSFGEMLKNAAGQFGIGAKKGENDTHAPSDTDDIDEPEEDV